MKARRMIVLLFAGTVWSAPAAISQSGGQEPPCMECHRPSHTAIDPEQFARSVHNSLDCTACHMQGVGKFPHTVNLAQAPDCTDCHSGADSPSIDFDKIGQAVKSSVHVQRVDHAFRCTNCHSPHYFIPASRMTDASEAVAAANTSCLHCHAPGADPAAQRSGFQALAEKHRLFPHVELHMERITCVSCHTARGEETLHLILPASEALRDCSGCHAKNSLLVTKLYKHLALQERSEHGWANAILFNNAYLTGANRNKWLDWGTFGLAALTVLGVVIHGLGRLLFVLFRRSS